MSGQPMLVLGHPNVRMAERHVATVFDFPNVLRPYVHYITDHMQLQGVPRTGVVLWHLPDFPLESMPAAQRDAFALTLKYRMMEARALTSQAIANMPVKIVAPTIRPLSCPFCGEQPELFPKNPKVEGTVWGEVRCTYSGCAAKPSVRDGEEVNDERGSDAYKRAAIQRWNRRSKRMSP